MTRRGSRSPTLAAPSLAGPALAVLAVLACAPGSARAEEAPSSTSPPPSSPARVLAQPDASFEYESPRPYPSFAWMAAQLVPSPEVAVGRGHRIDALGRSSNETPVAFGLRWQVTPVLWSWGTNRHVNRWRWFVVDPLARVSGSIELVGNLEYLWGQVDRFLVRPGVRANFPLVARGEYLSMSIGTSTYQYDGTMRVAYDVGAYVLTGLLGAQITVAPTNAPLTTLATLRIRMF